LCVYLIIPSEGETQLQIKKAKGTFFLGITLENDAANANSANVKDSAAGVPVD